MVSPSAMTMSPRSVVIVVSPIEGVPIVATKVTPSASSFTSSTVNTTLSVSSVPLISTSTVVVEPSDNVTVNVSVTFWSACNN